MRPRRASRRPVVGIVSNEFFDRELGRLGGFGWAARAVAAELAEQPEPGWDPLLLAGQGELADGPLLRTSRGVPLLRHERSRRYRAALRRRNPSLALTIDFRPNFEPVLEALPGSRVVVWVRDPRTADDDAKIGSLRLPGVATAPSGIDAIDCGSLRGVVDRMRDDGRRVDVAAVAPALAREKLFGAYRLEDEDVAFLPNPLPEQPERSESDRPSVVFVGRLDPIKRPWVVVEVGRRLPNVDFFLLGQPHFRGDGAWKPGSLPPNVHVVGHLEGRAKDDLVARAWMLVNTSIHEGLAISFLEALHCGRPLVSCQDPERVVSRFGAFVGRWDGTGLESVATFVEAITRLIDDSDLRTRLGHDGRAWVRETHSRARFTAAFCSLATE